MESDIQYWDRQGSRFYMGSRRVRHDNQSEFDLSDIRVLHAGVDTFKQLYRGKMNTSTFLAIETHYSLYPDVLYELGPCMFQILRSSKVSGYQYILKDLHYGVVVLLKSFYSDLTEDGTHLKIECSPHFIEERSPTEIDNDLLEIAKHLLDGFEQYSVAVHMCTDLKGFDIPKDFEQRLRTKSKRSFVFNGVDEFDIDPYAIALRHGKHESLTFGSASQLQFCIYDKIKEANHSDKLSFWQNIWKQTPGTEDPFISEYQNDDPVTRLEFRMHHTVVNQFSQGTGKGLNIHNFKTLAPHLTGLWRYCLNNFRLHYSKKYIHPVWQLLQEDVEIIAPSSSLIYQRSYKGGSSKSKRNVAFWIGNAVRLFARQNFKVDFTVDYFMQSGLQREIADYLGVIGTTDDIRAALHELIYQKFRLLQADGLAI